jgi:HKD family nuclease
MLKATFFKNNDHYNLIVGSSNLTAQALSTNKEWNIKVSALDDSGLVENVLGEFHTDFAKATPVTTDYIFRYEEVYKSNF